MKDTNEYSLTDWEETKNAALKIAMAAIHDVYREVKDEAEITDDEICRVKKAVEVIHIVTETKL